MTNTNGNDLSALYPKPKTYDERLRERQQRLERQRPRYPALKISLWSTLIVVIVLGAYRLTYYLLVDSLSSSEKMAYGASASIIIMIITLAAVYFVWMMISRMIGRVQSWTAPLTAAVALILFTTGAGLTLLLQYELASAYLVAGVLAVNAVVTWVAVAAAAIVGKDWQS